MKTGTDTAKYWPNSLCHLKLAYYCLIKKKPKATFFCISTYPNVCQWWFPAFHVFYDSSLLFSPKNGQNLTRFAFHPTPPIDLSVYFPTVPQLEKLSFLCTQMPLSLCPPQLSVFLVWCTDLYENVCHLLKVLFCTKSCSYLLIIMFAILKSQYKWWKKISCRYNQLFLAYTFSKYMPLNLRPSGFWVEHTCPLNRLHLSPNGNFDLLYGLWI